MASNDATVATLVPALPEDENLYLSLARAIAMDFRELEEILEAHRVDHDKWERIRTTERFQSMLRQAVVEWNAPMSAAERIKLKSLAIVELSLEEMYTQMHNDKEPLSSRVEVLKTVAKFGDVGIVSKEQGGGDKFSVVINLGADQQLKVSAELPKIRQLDAEEAR